MVESSPQRVMVNLSSDEIDALEPTLEIEVQESDIYPKYHEIISKVFLKIKVLKSMGTRELKLDIEEATAFKLMLEESTNAWQHILQKEKDNLVEGEEVYQEGIQTFRNILAKLPKFIQTQEMRRELVPQEERELTKAEEEAYWIIIKGKLGKSPALRERVKKYLSS